jgi:hypothetical protein
VAFAWRELLYYSPEGRHDCRRVAVTVADRLFTLTARGAIRAGVRVLPLVPDDLLVGVARRNIAKHGLNLSGLKDDIDRYAARYAEPADQEWYRCNESQPTLRASGQ